MDSTRAAAEVYSRQGFMVMETLNEYRVGETTGSVNVFFDKARVPLRIVGLSDRDSFKKQSNLFAELLEFVAPENYVPVVYPSARYYLVEAAD